VFDLSNVNTPPDNNGDYGDDNTLSGRKLFEGEESGVNENDELGNDKGGTATKKVSAKETEKTVKISNKKLPGAEAKTVSKEGGDDGLAVHYFEKVER